MTDAELNALHEKLDYNFRTLNSRLAGIESRLDGGFEDVLDLLARLLRPEEIAGARSRMRTPTAAMGDSPPPSDR